MDWFIGKTLLSRGFDGLPFIHVVLMDRSRRFEEDSEHVFGFELTSPNKVRALSPRST